MYQEEIFSNVITDAKRGGFDSLEGEVKGMEGALERLFTKIFDTSSSLAERDYNVTSL